jgi:hypothetical protein
MTMAYETGQRVRVKPDTPNTAAGGLEGEIVLVRRGGPLPQEYILRVAGYPSPILGKIDTSLSFWEDELEPLT